MKILMLMTTMLLFSCASSQYSSSLDNKTGNDGIDAAAVVIDLTEEIRKQPSAYVNGTGARATISVRNQACGPLFILNGSRVANYRMLYNLVPAEKFESVKVLQPRESFMYGYGASFKGTGVILVTTKKEEGFIAAE